MMNSETKVLRAPWANYWGKAKPSSSEGPRWHPVVYHCLDVAASGAVLLDQDPRLLDSLVRAARIPKEQVRRWIPFILALHDLGKFSVPFQCQVPELAKELLGWKLTQSCSLRHDSIGYQFFASTGDGVIAWLAEDERIPVLVRGDCCSDSFDLLDLLEPWMKASCGHHGRPPDSADLPSWVYPPDARKAARCWVDEVTAVMAPGPINVDTPDALRASSWIVAGLAVLADWIGSNQHFFCYHQPTLSLPEYWSLAQNIAREAVAACGLLPSRPVSRRAPQQLFPKLKALTPLQAKVDSLPLAEGPQLWIVEDVTGSGKTEAALLLAHRMMAEGLADGVYFALPTMATANGMYGRVEGIFENFFEGEPSLTLAHGKTTLFKALQETASDVDPEQGNPSASRHGAAWLADNRKKALLASIGVGTIDQAMLAVLPSKHSPLRLLGLHRKVLIVDEVHACDVYMNRVLQNLLEFHVALGGSAILLSATLPLATRQQLSGVYQKALGSSGSPSSEHYPLLTISSARGVEEIPCEASARSRREVDVKFIHDLADAVALLREAAQQGKCAVWIRNTVTDAIEAFQLLQDVPGAQLFHARFVVGDRQRIERECLARFGLESGPGERSCQILIATQVVEQSLDLDFDVMISDLAPIDLLIQRAGRLHRHVRSADGTRLSEGADGRPPPVLHVLAPPHEPDPAADWLAGSAVKRSAFVYERPSLLWATQQTLARLGAIRTPAEARTLIEEVFCADCPEGLQKQENKAIGKTLTHRSAADMSALPFEQGYTRDALRWLDDTHTRTRLGDETTTVRLCRVEEGRYVPFFQNLALSPGLNWQLSEVNVRASLISAPLGDPRVADARKAMPDEGRWCIPVVVEPDEQDGWVGYVLDGRGEERKVSYDKCIGLRVTASKPTSA